MGVPPYQVTESNTKKPQVSFVSQGVMPPSPLYIHEDDKLLITFITSQAGVTITARYRLLLPTGEVKIGEHRFVSDATRTPTNTTFGLTEGYLLSLVVFCSTTDIGRGRFYVRAAIGRSSAATNDLVETLCAGYLEAQRGLSWPFGTIEPACGGQGNITDATGADPAAGVEWSITVPFGARWRLISVHASLVTDATVANRFAMINVANTGGLRIFRANSNTAHTASINGLYSFSAAPRTVDGANNTFNIGLPPDLWLLSGDVISSIVQNLQAGDNWGAPVARVEEWLTF